MSDNAIERRMEELRGKAAQYAEAFAEREHLEEWKKSELAILMKKYEAKGFASATAQEREARADPDYKVTLKGLQAAIEKSEALRWELRLAELSIEIWRTRQASKRAERRGYGA